MRHWGYSSGLWLLVLACASGTAQDTPNAGLPEELQNSPVRGFVDDPIVAFRALSGGLAPSSSSGPNPCAFGIPYEIPVDEARALGFDVDADYALLESEFVTDVAVSGDDVSAAKVHVLGRVDHMVRIDAMPPPGVALEEATPPGCPSAIQYQLTVQIFTDDGSLTGTFAARAGATPVGSEPLLNIHSESDLRNFGGSLPVARESSRPFFGVATVQWYHTGVDSGSEFFFQPHVLYQDSDGFCLDPFCPSAGSAQTARLSFPVASPSEVAPFSEFVRSVAAPTITSLSEFVGAMGPYHPDVRLWVVAPSAEPSSVQLRVRIDGEDVQTPPLALTHIPRLLSEGAVGGWIDLGELDESVSVELEVEKPAGLSSVIAHIVMGGCEVKAADARCAEPGCVVRSAALVSPPACSFR